MSHSPASDEARQDGVEAYEAPAIRDLGSFTELTQGTTSNKKTETVGGVSTGPA